jgi:MtN3 and saliva related transmembrane protein
MDIFFQVLGYIAATSTTIAFVPQMISIFKTRDTRSISLGMYLIFVFGVICWLAYGIYKVDWPIIVANAVSVVLSSIILVFKIVNVAKGEKSINKLKVNKDNTENK